MSYVISPNVRTIGGRIECQWSDINRDGYVIIDGYASADYSNVVGGEKVDIRINSPTDPVITVTLNPGDNSALNIIDRINSFIPGIATVPPFSNNPAIRLQHSTYLEIVDNYDRVNDFAKIGLPLIVRDGRDGYSSHNYRLLDGTLLGGGEGQSLDRFDFMSLPIYVDPGSNNITMWLTIENFDTQCTCGLQVLIMWGNGFEGEIDDTIVLPIVLPLDGIVLTIPNQEEVPVFVFRTPTNNIYLPLTPIAVPKIQFTPITVPVPRGANKFRISISGGILTSGSEFHSFIISPKITGAVYQGAS